jgi:hypothetical protein
MTWGCVRHDRDAAAAVGSAHGTLKAESGVGLRMKMRTRSCRCAVSGLGCRWHVVGSG